MTDLYYRYCDATSDDIEWPLIYLCYHRVVKTTPLGVCISDGGTKDRFILTSALKKWAYPTKQGAWNAYLKRKQSQLKHVTRYHNYCKTLDRNLKGCNSLEDYETKEHRFFKETDDELLFNPTTSGPIL